MISDSDSNEVTSAHVDYTAKLPLDQKVYFQYYVQDDTDDGVLMNTKIKVKEVIWSLKLKLTSCLSLIKSKRPICYYIFCKYQLIEEN